MASLDHAQRPSPAADVLVASSNPATVLITEERVDPKTAQGILRHANSDVTMQIYTHAQDEAKRKALEKFEARLVQ